MTMVLRLVCVSGEEEKLSEFFMTTLVFNFIEFKCNDKKKFRKMTSMYKIVCSKV